MDVILGHQDANICVATSNMAAGHCQVDRLGRRIHIGPHFTGLQLHCNQRETRQWAASLQSLPRRRCFIVKTRDHLVLQFLNGNVIDNILLYSNCNMILILIHDDKCSVCCFVEVF